MKGTILRMTCEATCINSVPVTDFVLIVVGKDCVKALVFSNLMTGDDCHVPEVYKTFNESVLIAQELGLIKYFLEKKLEQSRMIRSFRPDKSQNYSTQNNLHEDFSNNLRFSRTSRILSIMQIYSGIFSDQMIQLPLYKS